MKCLKCAGYSIKLDWRPSDGYDPALRKFRCIHCKHEWYDRTGRHEKGKEVKSE